MRKQPQPKLRKDKTKHRNRLLDERKAIPVWNLTKRKDVSKQIATLAEARQDISSMLDEHEEEPRSVRERLRNHRQEQTVLRKKEKDLDR